MATVAPPPQFPKKPGVSSGAKASGADALIEDRIEEAQRALWWAELVRSSLTLAIVSMLVLLAWLVVDQWIYSPGMVARLLISLCLLGIGIWYVFRRVMPLLRSSIRPEYAARSLERDLPELRQSLTSYVTLRTERSAGDLRSRVVRSIGSSTAGKLQRHEALPAEATGTFRWWIATSVAFAMLAGYVVATPKNSLQTVARLAAPIASIDPARRVTIEEVLPGDIEAIAGRAVAVSASVDGIHDDEEVICVWDLASGRKTSVLSMDSESGRHQGEIWIPHSASGSLRYTIAAGDAEAGPYRLRVQDLPVVALESVRYEPPAYTRQPSHTSSSGAITALDGTTVQILATTNRPVAKGKIEFNPRQVGDRVRATAGATQMSVAKNGTSLSVSFALRTAKGRSAAVELEGYRITVTDASGQTNPEPIIYPIRVVSDLAPEVSITMPFRSPKEVPIDAQQIIEVHGLDPDYGLREIRLEVRAGIELIAEPVLWSDPRGQPGNQVAEYRFRPQEHDLQIGATVQIVAVATDNRSSDTDTRLEPNVTVTDPVELKITASAPLPEQNDPNAGGLSEPDDRPASDHQESSGDEGGNEGGEGEEQGGGGGSGGEGESGESQSGQNDSGNSSSQSGSGESESEGGGGSGANSDDREGDGNQSDDSGSGNASDTSSGDSSGKPSGGEGDSNQPGNQESESANGDPTNDSSADGSPSPDSAGTGDSDAQPMNQDGNTGSQDQSTGKDGSGKDSANSTTESGAEESSVGNTGNNNAENGNEQNGGDPESSEQQNSKGGTGDRESSGDQTNSDNTGSSGDSGNSSQDAGQQGSADNVNSGNEPASDPEASNSDSDGQSKQAPKHDGEAFERMRDYLEKKQQKGRGQGGDDRSDQSGQEQSTSSDGSQDSNTGEQTDSGNSEESSSGAGSDEQQNSDSNDGSESTDGAGDSSQDSAGDERGSEESAGDESDDSEGRGSKPQTGEQGSQDSSQGSESNTGESSSAESNSGDSSKDNTDSGPESNAGEGETTQNSGEESNSSSESPSDPNEGANESQSSSSSSDAASNQSNRNSNASPSQSGTGEGSDIGESAESSEPPDPVNVEYTKKATDMVLDYLDETRDAPDQDLLDELNWSEDDLKRFAERWQKVRQMESAAPGEKRELEDALKSLGMRDRSGRTTEIREKGDSLRNIRDSGNRKPPPAAYRDAFDAFRRAMGRSQ